MIGLLCRTPQKESRHELLRRVAGGGGVFKGENSTKVHLPGANLDDIAKQADDLLEVCLILGVWFVFNKVVLLCLTLNYWRI